MREDRGFEGVYIPSELWLDKDIPALEKMIFVEIRSLDNENGCYASNQHFKEMFGITERQVQRIVSSLKNRKFISLESFDGRKRVLRAIKEYSISSRSTTGRNRVDKNVIADTTDAAGLNSQECHITNPIIENKKEKNNKYLPLSIILKEKILARVPDARIKETQVNDWCNDIRLMVEQDKRTEAQIRGKIEVVFAPGQFWGGVVRSAGTLRLRWNEGKLPGDVPPATDDLPEEDVIELRAYDIK